VIFWTTLCHTPPVLPLPGRTELRDFGSNVRPGLSTRPDAVPSPRVLRISAHWQSSHRCVALVPSLSLFGISAVLDAIVRGSLYRWPRLPVALQLPAQFIPVVRDKPAGMGLHE
jgi:hypothetical protein